MIFFCSGGLPGAPPTMRGAGQAASCAATERRPQVPRTGLTRGIRSRNSIVERKQKCAANKLQARGCVRKIKKCRRESAARQRSLADEAPRNYVSRAWTRIRSDIGQLWRKVMVRKLCFSVWNDPVAKITHAMAIGRSSEPVVRREIEQANHVCQHCLFDDKRSMGKCSRDTYRKLIKPCFDGAMPGNEWLRAERRMEKGCPHCDKCLPKRVRG